MSKAKVLIIEDDEEISRLTAMYLEAEGFETSIVDDGLAAIDKVKRYSPDLIVLDLMLPGLSGVDICKQLKNFYQGAIIILTACDDDISEVSLLKLGADDFLTKPLKPHVLVARIEALLRRTQKNQLKKKSNRFIVDTEARTIMFDGEMLNLTGAEFEMFAVLEKHIGKPVSREDCCKALRGIEHDFHDRSIDMRISGLRKKIHDDKPPYQVILTVRNKGYMLANG